MIAASRMYDVAPGATAAGQRLIAWVAAATDVDLTIVDDPFAAPLEALWERPDLGRTFMGGWPWAEQAAPPRRLAAPVPSPSRYRGHPVHFTDFVVREDRPYRTLADTFGGRIADTVETSHSGWNAARRGAPPVRVGVTRERAREAVRAGYPRIA